MAENDELEFDLDDEEPTLALDGDEEEPTLQIESDDADDGLSLQPDDDDVSSDESEGESDEEEWEEEPLPPPVYKASSDIYAVFLVLASVAYILAIAVTLLELKEYSDPEQFLWGLFGQ